MSPMTLYYFDFPGRGEAARLLLTLGKIEFTDKRIPFAEWPEWKGKMPFGQVPVLELSDGNMLAEMAAIDRYCAAITGLLPLDPLLLAEAEQAYCAIADIWEPIGPVMMVARGNASEQEVADAWAALLAPDGTFRQRMALLDKHLAKRPGKFLAGDQLCHADLSVFGSMSLFKSGWMSGMPKDILEAYPALKEFRNMIANLPDVADYYAKDENQDYVRQQGFTPDT